MADTLAGRLKAAPVGGTSRGTTSRADYRRDRVTNWIATALREAGRDEELRALYESEARATGSYERLVNYLLETRRFEDAERWAREGIAATSEKYPGIANHLAESLCEIARERKQWDVVAAHAARPFFDHPSRSTFDELMKAAEEGQGRGARPCARPCTSSKRGPCRYEVISPRPAAQRPPAPSLRARSDRARPGRPRRPPEPKAAAPARLKIDPAWPLPMPDYLVPLLSRPGRYDPGAASSPGSPAGHGDRRQAAGRGAPLVRQDAGRGRNAPGFTTVPRSYADRVADAVTAAYPERAIEIYLAALNAQLPHAQPSAYEAAAGYLRKLRPIYEALGRAGEWAALLASIREKYRNRPRFMELLDRLDGRTIVQSSRTRRK